MPFLDNVSKGIRRSPESLPSFCGSVVVVTPRGQREWVPSDQESPDKVSSAVLMACASTNGSCGRCRW
jgi:hypothetical protein